MIAGALFFTAAGSALAAVFVNYVPRHVNACIKVGVWHQPGSGGPHWAVIKIYRYGSASAFWIKHTRAANSHWKFWQVCPAPGHYIVRYNTPGFNPTYYTYFG